MKNALVHVKNMKVFKPMHNYTNNGVIAGKGIAILVY